MLTDETILENLLDRAIDPAKKTADELGVQMFCMEVRNDAKLIEQALQLIVAKIRSSNVTESIRAIALLEECMIKCGNDFQNEVAKFRFLNDLIRLVSTKYKGAQTPAAIKQRIMKCLLLWTTEFPQKTKIRDAYDMLSKEESWVEHASGVPPKTKRESTLGIDEQLLEKLLHSGDPENLKRANLLIQHRVNQEARHNELVQKQKSELVEVENTVSLLNEMLLLYEKERGRVSEETKDAMRDLYIACKKHKPILQRLPELIGSIDNELVVTTLATNELLLSVIKKYKRTVAESPAAESATRNSSVTSNTDLLTGLLTDGYPSSASTLDGSTSSYPSATTAAAKSRDPFAELSENFSVDSLKGGEKTTSDELFGSIDVLNDVIMQPVKTLTTTTHTTQRSGVLQTNVPNPQVEKRAFRELPEIDELSEKIFKTSLQSVGRSSSFKKDSERLTLNDLAAKEKFVTSHESASVEKSTPHSLHPKNVGKPNGNVAAAESLAAVEEQDDVMLSSVDEKMVATIAADISDDIQILSDNSKESECPAAASQLHLPQKHLSDIDVCLDNVVPSSEKLVLLDDDDIKITLNFTENRPSKQVSVVVISTFNKSKLHIKDLQFEASVKKPSKVRLLPPTDVEMPPYKPFRPPTPINQVMLLLNPTGKPVDVTCIVGYKLGDDPDAVKESLVAKGIPYVD